MHQLFNNLIFEYCGETFSADLVGVLSTILTVISMIAIIHMITSVIKPRCGVIRKVIYITLIVVTALCALHSVGVSLINITQIPLISGVSA